MIKKYHVSKNLLNPDSKTTNEQGAERYGDSFPAGTYYVLNNTANNVNWRDGISTTATHAIAANTGEVVTTSSDLVVWHFNRETAIMVAKSSVAIPFEPYGDSFKDWFYREYGTETDTITSLPKTIIGDGQPISSYTIKGNMSQSGTPTPSNPVYPQETGDKTANLFPRPVAARTETIGDITFSIDSSGTLTINGLTGENAVSFSYDLASDFTFPTSVQQGGNAYLYYWNTFSVNGTIRFLYNNTTVDYWSIMPNNRVISKFDNLENATVNGIMVVIPANSTIVNGKISLMVTNDGNQATVFEPSGYKIPISLNGVEYPIYITEPLRKSLDGSNVYDTIESNGTLTRRVDANGDALATPTTEQVTVPTLTTTGTAEQFNVLTTLAPSEVSLTYHGWHEHNDTKFTTP